MKAKTHPILCAIVAAACALTFSLLATSNAAAFCTTWQQTPWSSPGSVKTMALSPLFPNTMRTWLQVAMQQWNMSNSALVYGAPVYTSNWTNYAFQGELVHFPSVGFPDTLPGVSSGIAVSPTHAGGKVSLNSSFVWINDSQNIAWKIADTATIVVHEIGHVNGMAHPADCADGITAAEQASVMTVINTGTRRYPNSDDIAYQTWRY